MITDSNRTTAFYILKDVKNKKSYSNIATNSHIKKGDPKSAGFVRELVYGTIKNEIKIDYILDQLLKEPINKLDSHTIIILRMGIYQIMHMNSVPDYAAVNESVKLAKSFAKGRDRLINGVLREYSRKKESIEFPKREDDLIRSLSVQYSFAHWIIRLWIDEYGEEEAEKMLSAFNETPRLILRVNLLKISRDSLIKKLRKEDIAAGPSRMAEETVQVEGGGLITAKMYKDGLYSIQDDSSFSAVKLLDPQPGETIIDTCAAPGGKSLAIAETMRNKGKVLSMDISIRKLRQTRNDAKRLGLDILEIKSWDSTRTDSDYIGKADRVIVDAPCSALGLVRKKPEIKYKDWNDELAVSLPNTQLGILKASADYLKPGGVLVYCTCTLCKVENEDVTKRFLELHPSFKKEKEVKLLPHINHTNGFYICKFRKSSKIAAI